MTTVTRRFAVAGACAAAVFGIGTPTASAGQSESIRTRGGLVTFTHVDEEITAEDTRADGLGVQAVLVWTDATDHSRTEFVVDATGADNLSKVNDLAIPERTLVTLTLCYVSDQGPTDCSRPQRAVA